MFLNTDTLLTLLSVVLLLDIKKFQAEVQRITSENLVKLNNRLKLPDSVLKKVQGQTIDIIPSEL